MNNTSTGHPQDEVAMASLVSTIIYMYIIYIYISSIIYNHLHVSSIIIMYHQVSLCHLVHEADHGSSGAIWTGDSDASTAGQQRDTVHGLRASRASGSTHRGPHRRREGAPWQDSTPPCWHRPCDKLKASSRQAQSKFKSSNMLVVCFHTSLDKTISTFILPRLLMNPNAGCSQILLDNRVSFSPSPTPWYLFPSPTFLCSSTELKNPAQRTHEIGFTRFYKIFRSRSYVMERFRRSLAPCQFHLRHYCSMHRYSCVYISISIYI